MSDPRSDYALLRNGMIAAARAAMKPRLLYTVPLDADANPGAQEWEQPGVESAVDATLGVLLARRDEVFGPGNDKVWGEGEWVRCADCLDAGGLPSYHHKAAHSGRAGPDE